MKQIEDLIFPSLAFVKDGTLFFAMKPQDLLICNEKGFKNGFYNDLFLVDSIGRGYKVNDVHKIKKIGILFGYDIFFEKKYVVNLVLDDQCIQFKLQDFKEKILSAIKNKSFFWNEGENLRSIYNSINNSVTFNELFEKLAKIF